MYVFGYHLFVLGQFLIIPSIVPSAHPTIDLLNNFVL